MINSTGPGPSLEYCLRSRRGVIPDGFCIFMGNLAHALAAPRRAQERHMNQNIQAGHVSKKRVVYTIPGMEAVTVRRDHKYRTTDSGTLTMDVYCPPGSGVAGTRIPAVVFVTGFTDAGMRKMLGCAPKEMGSYISWAQLVAASGMVAITYANEDPATDVHAVLDYVRQNATDLNVDENRMAVWACSGNVPNALSVLTGHGDGFLKCAALCYGYMLDLDGSTRVADAARQFGFVNPCAGKSIEELPPEVPLFIARAGHDEMPGLNDALDRFVAKALTRNLPVMVANHATAPHAFDLFHDSEMSHEIIRQVLTFLRFNLTSPGRVTTMR